MICSKCLSSKLELIVLLIIIFYYYAPAYGLKMTTIGYDTSTGNITYWKNKSGLWVSNLFSVYSERSRFFMFLLFYFYACWLVDVGLIH